MGAELTTPAWKLSLQDLYPLAGRGNGTPTKGRWGWGHGDDHHGAQVEMSAPKNSRCKSYTPYTPATARSGPSASRTMGVDDHHGGQVEMSAAEKFSLQILYPLIGHLSVSEGRAAHSDLQCSSLPRNRRTTLSRSHSRSHRLM